MKKRLRDVALKEEVNYVSSDAGPTATLLGITNSLSSELAVQILNHLFKKLNELCLVQGGKSNKVKDTLQPAVIIQESLAVYIREQTCPVILSGDLLQQFLIVTFNKLDRGDIWDDEFELNTMLQTVPSFGTAAKLGKFSAFRGE
ncbi:hypothetical protein BHE74_00011462 [Ensete ventricosum]|nr:hypothetical protein BHE74_00011462 [Ensete ventricosum]